MLKIQDLETVFDVCGGDFITLELKAVNAAGIIEDGQVWNSDSESMPVVGRVDLSLQKITFKVQSAAPLPIPSWSYSASVIQKESSGGVLGLAGQWKFQGMSITPAGSAGSPGMVIRRSEYVREGVWCATPQVRVP